MAIPIEWGAKFNVQEHLVSPDLKAQFRVTWWRLAASNDLLQETSPFSDSQFPYPINNEISLFHASQLIQSPSQI
jgi:hypothetical protein